MIDGHHALPISRQAQLAGISRGSVYYVSKSIGAADLVLMRHLDTSHLEHPFMGARMLRDQLNREGFTVGRKHVRSLMARMGMEALFLWDHAFSFVTISVWGACKVLSTCRRG